MIQFVLMLVFEWAQKDENPMSGHKVMAQKAKQVRKFEYFDLFGHYFMANDRIVVFFIFNDSFWCGESNDIWIYWIRSDLRKLRSIVRKCHNTYFNTV